MTTAPNRPNPSSFAIAKEPSSFNMRASSATGMPTKVKCSIVGRDRLVSMVRATRSVGKSTCSTGARELFAGLHRLVQLVV